MTTGPLNPPTTNYTQTEAHPQDIFCVVFVDGKLELYQPIDHLLRVRLAAAELASKVDLPVKVMGCTLTELINFLGVDKEAMSAHLAGCEHEFRAFGTQACLETLADSDDKSLRSEALKALQVLQPGLLPSA